MRGLSKYYISNTVVWDMNTSTRNITTYWLKKIMGNDYLRGRQEFHEKGLTQMCTRMKTWAGSDYKRRIFLLR
jgi:hypothetical protein